MAIIFYPKIKNNTKVALRAVIKYATKEEKTDEFLVSGKDILPESAFEEMIAFKKVYDKEGGRQYIHVVQSFSPDEIITHQQAHEIGVQFAEYYKGFQVLISTHKDKDHIHNHLLINSVSFEDGRKFQQGPGEMKNVQDFSDKLCLAAGLSVIDRESTNPKKISTGEYRAAQKQDSWKFKLISSIDLAMSASSSKEEFIRNMNQLGYSVNWSDSRKNITYTTPNAMKCRDSKLHDVKYLKENMEAYYGLREFKATESSRGTITETIPTGDIRNSSRTMGSVAEDDDRVHKRNTSDRRNDTCTSDERTDPCGFSKSLYVIAKGTGEKVSRNDVGHSQTPIAESGQNYSGTEGEHRGPNESGEKSARRAASENIRNPKDQNIPHPAFEGQRNLANILSTASILEKMISPRKQRNDDRKIGKWPVSKGSRTYTSKNKKQKTNQQDYDWER